MSDPKKPFKYAHLWIDGPVRRTSPAIELLAICALLVVGAIIIVAVFS
jgi:hypothetical protein